MLVHFKDDEHENGAIQLVIAPANITVENLKRSLKSCITEGNMVRIENNTSKELEIREIQHNVRLTNQRIDDINSEAAMLFKEAFEGREGPKRKRSANIDEQPPSDHEALKPAASTRKMCKKYIQPWLMHCLSVINFVECVYHRSFGHFISKMTRC